MSDHKPLRVLVKCKVIKQLKLEGCTEEQAEEDPWQFVVDEMELERIDDAWQIIELEEWVWE